MSRACVYRSDFAFEDAVPKERDEDHFGDLNGPGRLVEGDPSNGRT